MLPVLLPEQFTLVTLAMVKVGRALTVTVAVGSVVAVQPAPVRELMAKVVLAVRVPVLMLKVLPVMLSAWGVPPFTRYWPVKGPVPVSVPVRVVPEFEQIRAVAAVKAAVGRGVTVMVTGVAGLGQPLLGYWAVTL